jgi:hypothetical protein
MFLHNLLNLLQIKWDYKKIYICLCKCAQTAKVNDLFPAKRESDIAYRVASAVSHYIRCIAFGTCRKEVDKNQQTNRVYCLRQAESILNGT